MFEFALIGDPVEKALSPVMQNAMLESLGRNEKYGRFQVDAHSLASWLESDEAKALKAFNTTMPLKQEIIKHLTSISPEAKSICAVNTVVCRNGELHGYNTDGIGFVRALKELRADISSSKVAILGSGGGAYSVAQTLHAQKACKEIKIYCRKKEQSFAPEIEVLPFDSIYSDRSFCQNDIVIQATPLGMYGNKEYESLAFLDELKKDALVCDLIYRPLETRFLKKAREQALDTMNGLSMLVYQGISALELFLDRKLDSEKMEKVAKEAIQKAL